MWVSKSGVSGGGQKVDVEKVHVLFRPLNKIGTFKFYCRGVSHEKAAFWKHFPTLKTAIFSFIVVSPSLGLSASKAHRDP